MNLLQILQNGYVSIIAGGLGGIATAWITQRVLNKRGIFSYTVTHNKVGITAKDAILGNVAVSWNGNPMQNLYLTTVEMKNESMNDYENVVVSSCTSDTRLMTEQTQLLDIPNILEWSEKYKKQLHTGPGSPLTESQLNIYNSSREYVVPILNRGQSIRITYLNSAKGTAPPSVWLFVTQKGVKLKFQVPKNQILGVPQGQAALFGVFIGVAVLIALSLSIQEQWLAASIAMIYGLVAQLPGAYAIKLIRRAKELIGG